MKELDDKTLKENLTKTRYACGVMKCLEQEIQPRRDSIETGKGNVSLFTPEAIQHATEEVGTIR